MERRFSNSTQLLTESLLLSALKPQSACLTHITRYYLLPAEGLQMEVRTLIFPALFRVAALQDRIYLLPCRHTYSNPYARVKKHRRSKLRSEPQRMTDSQGVFRPLTTEQRRTHEQEWWPIAAAGRSGELERIPLIPPPTFDRPLVQ